MPEPKITDEKERSLILNALISHARKCKDTINLLTELNGRKSTELFGSVCGLLSVVPKPTKALLFRISGVSVLPKKSVITVK